MDIQIAENRKWIEILVDGEKVKEGYKPLYKAHLKELKQAEDRKELKALCFKIEVKGARLLIYKWLAMRGYLQAELEEKLRRLNVDCEAISLALEECASKGYLNDEKERERRIEAGKQRGIGPRMIARKLADQTGPTVQEYSAQEEREKIKEWIEKKKRRAAPFDLKAKMRLYRFLAGKGFDSNLIREELFVDA